MNRQGSEKHGNFVVKSATAFSDLLDERMVISGSDGSSRSIIVTTIVDNIVYFRAGDDVHS